MPITENTNSSKRTSELIIYISSKLKDKPNFGSILLAKALYLIDSISYLKTGDPLTDLSYIKQELGPTPEPKKFLPIRDELINTGDLEKVTTEYFGKMQHRYVAKRQPDSSVFQTEEIYLIDDVLESIRDHTGKELTDHTHTFLSWIFATHKEELPFYTFLLEKIEPELADYKWAKKAIKEYESDRKKSSK